MGIWGVPRGYRGLRGVTWGYMGLQGVTGGYRGLQGFTRGYKRLQAVTGGDKALQWVTKSVCIKIKVDEISNEVLECLCHCYKEENVYEKRSIFQPRALT